MAVGSCRTRLMCGALVLLSWNAAAWAQGASAAAQPESGREWLAKCGAFARGDVPSQADGFDAGLCRGWIEGLLDMNTIYRSLGALERTAEGFCVPGTTTLEEVAKAIARYVEERRASLHFSARILAYMALRQAFPCSRPA